MSIFILIPLAPLLAFLILAFSGRSLGEASHRIAIPAVGLSLALSLAAFAGVAGGGSISISLYRLLESGGLIIDLNLYVDQLTVLVLLLVTGVSFVVHVYSSRYMIGDPRYKRFFAVTSLFTFAMIMLVMSNNLLITYMFWEVMGICSYLLISHWAERETACKAATKAFLVNSVADVGLGFGVILTFAVYGTLDIQQIVSRAADFSGQTMTPLSWIGSDLTVGVNTLITLFLFMGALGKSAQVPFHVWLPFAMEAPTPVSALIHAATMVNAGPFLLVRLSPLVVLAPSAMAVIAVVGATTALFGALVALTQSDIKKLLAYSTISQIGFMIFMCGVGAFVVAIFHLLAHGFLKGFLFLSTGNALRSAGSHGHAHIEPVRRPLGRSLLFGALLLGCLPPFILFSGAYEGMWTAHDLPSSQWTFWVIGLATVFLTAMYVFRGVVSLFQQSLIVGDAGNPDSIRVQPRFFSSAHLPGLAVAGAAVAGILIAVWSWFVPFLAPALGRPSVSVGEVGLFGGFSFWLALPLLAAVGGWGLAYSLHLNRRSGLTEAPGWMKTAYVLFLNKLYFDEVYDAYVVRPTIRFAGWLWREIDVRGIDRLIRGIASFSLRQAQWSSTTVEAHGVDRVVQGVASSSLHLSVWLLRVGEARGVDSVVQGIATVSLRLSRWLWRSIDLRRTDRTVERLGHLAHGTGRMLGKFEPRTLHHHLAVVICWLVLAIGVMYWLAR